MRKKIKISKIGFVLALLCLAFLQACVLTKTELELPPEEVKIAETPAPVIREETLIAQLALSPTATAKLEEGKPLTNFVNEAWLGDKVLPLGSGQTSLPRRLTRYHDLTFITPRMAFSEVADLLSSMIETPIQIVGEDSKVQLIDKKGIRFKGNINRLLDMLATNFDMVWRYDRYKHRIVFARVLRREVNFFVGAGAQRFVKKISMHSGADNSFSSNRQILLDPWAELKEELKEIMPKGSEVRFSPSTGKITLITRPAAMRRAMRLIAKRNKILQKQIYFTVQLLELTIAPEKLEQFNGSFSLAQLLRGQSDGLLLVRDGNAAAPSAPAPPINAAGVQIKTPANANKVQRLETSSLNAVLSALSKIGDISVLTSANNRTRNGKAFPVRQTSQLAYVSQIKGGEFVPAQLETSFYLNLLPLILPRDRIQMDLSVSLKSLNEMRQYRDGAQRIQLPQLSTKIWTQEMIVPNEATLLLSGFESRSKGNGTHSILILLVTPTIIENE